MRTFAAGFMRPDHRTLGRPNKSKGYQQYDIKGTRRRCRYLGHYEPPDVNASRRLETRKAVLPPFFPEPEIHGGKALLRSRIFWMLASCSASQLSMMIMGARPFYPANGFPWGSRHSQASLWTPWQPDLYTYLRSAAGHVLGSAAR